MMPYRSTLLLLTCVTCLAIAPSPGRNLTLGEEAIAQAPTSTSPSPAAVRATPPATVLKQGDRGAEVVELQMKLKQLGYFTGAADGAFGETTKIAVAKFQKTVKLPADGAVGATTWDKLQAAQDEKANPPKKTKRKAAAKPRSKKKMLLFLLSAIVVAASVGGAVYLLLKSFGKALNLEPEKDEADDANELLEDNPFDDPENHKSNGTAAHRDTSSNGNSKNGYAGTDITGSYTSEERSDIEHELSNGTSASDRTESTNADGHLPSFSPHEEQAPQDTLPIGNDSSAKGNPELPNVDKNFSDEEKITEAPNPSANSSSLSPKGETKPQDGLQIEKTTRLPKIDIVEELIKDLQGGNSQKRRKAIWELAQRGDSRAVQPLVELMIDSDSQQRSLILEALSQICTRTLKPINRALGISLQDENADVRKNAIRDLTRIYELFSQINQMLRHAADDPDAEVKQTAQWALGQLNRVRKNSGVDNFPDGKSDERSQ